MKKFLILLLTLTVPKCYRNLHKLKHLWANYETQNHHQKQSSSKVTGKQVQLTKELVCHQRSLLASWISLAVLIAILRSLNKFSNLLSHYWQSSKNNFPTLLDIVEGFLAPKHPLTIGAI